MATGPGLRERKNARTRTAITRAALELSLEVGFERATIAQIAERADVSPRTVHGWFPAKEDILLGAADLPIDRLAAELADGDGDTLDRVDHWLMVEGARNTEPEELRRLRHRVLRADPELRTHQYGRQKAAEDLIAAAIARETGAPPGGTAARALAAAIMTTILAMQERYADETAVVSGDLETTDVMLRAALAAIRPPSGG